MGVSLLANHNLMGKLNATQASLDEWFMPARLMPYPHAAAEKAAMESSPLALASTRTITKTRLAFSTAAVVVAVAVPSLSL